MVRYATVLSGLLLIGSLAHAQSVQVARSLPGFQCNALVHVWNGQGPMPPPVSEFAGPEQSAMRVGIAMSTVIVDNPPRTADGRTRVLRPNGILLGSICRRSVRGTPQALHPHAVPLFR